ncbi:cell division cycle protein 123 [Anaeramoeba flamelloides]|uniref:Cell division cycle protein 123 n=1 Tax=Anaeramoeba flamelloides TaxID=1746091 RepID=A0AAV8A342_9EUKA|nr:cell division cycle protein 123 [Anaeramoeba flamelloides]
MSTVLINIDEGEIPGDNEDEKRETLKEWSKFNLSNYYSSFEGLTPRTEFVTMTFEECKSLLKALRNPNLKEEHDIDNMKSLTKRMEKAFKSIGGEKFFVKLNSRSAKDAVDKVPNRLQPLLEKQLEIVKQKRSLSTDLVALRRSMFESMSISSCKEALDVFSYSYRIVSDLKRSLTFEDLYDQQIIVRQFLDWDIKYEFRGWVTNGKLNALSQYYSNCFFDYGEEINAIKEKITNFVDQNLQESLKMFPKAVVDFGIDQDKNVFVVELNPFSSLTGCCLFEWEKDQKTLTSGELEFRYRTEPRSDKYLVALMSPWARLFPQNLQEKDEKKENGEQNKLKKQKKKKKQKQKQKKNSKKDSNDCTIC